MSSSPNTLSARTLSSYKTLQDCPRPPQAAAAEAAPPSAGRPLDAGWRQWIVENRLRHCTPASMVATMASGGVDPREAAVAIAQMESDPGYLAALKMRELRDKLASTMANLQRLWEQAPDYAHVEKRSRVSREEFIERYVRGCRPVVLTDVTHDWPAMARWSPQDLKERFGHLTVEIQAERNANQRYEVDKLAHRRQVRLADFVDRVLQAGHSNDEYLTANNELLRRPEFAPLLDDIGSLPPVCDRATLGERSSFWCGPGGTVTPLHHDTLMLFHTQVVGRKRWRFISPLQTPRLYNHYQVFSDVNLDAVDLQRHPEFAGVTVLDVVVEPGETMFLPLGWWHQVSSLDLSLSFSYSNLDVPNTYTYVNPNITNW
ncbi:cupin-like domain-containing protein [Ramlibacter rhizophilus]|nr:cupin-like domain-containing protein [Ramlibacter rhizophilus]